LYIFSDKYSDFLWFGINIFIAKKIYLYLIVELLEYAAKDSGIEGIVFIFL
jgi:hypothetical protein